MKTEQVKVVRVVKWVALGALLFGGVGCASLDRVGTKLEMIANRIAEGKEATYEGELKAIQRFGSMTSMEFTDGKMVDVEEAHPELYAGDTVRLYKTHKGLEARLWKSRESKTPTVDALR